MEKKKNLCTKIVENFFYPHIWLDNFVDGKSLHIEEEPSYAHFPILVCILIAHFHNTIY